MGCFCSNYNAKEEDKRHELKVKSVGSVIIIEGLEMQDDDEPFNYGE